MCKSCSSVAVVLWCVRAGCWGFSLFHGFIIIMFYLPWPHDQCLLHFQIMGFRCDVHTKIPKGHSATCHKHYHCTRHLMSYACTHTYTHACMHGRLGSLLLCLCDVFPTLIKPHTPEMKTKCTLGSSCSWCTGGLTQTGGPSLCKCLTDSLIIQYTV